MAKKKRSKISVLYHILNKTYGGLGTKDALALLKKHKFDAIKSKPLFKMHGAVTVFGNEILQRKASKLLFDLV